MLDMPEKSNVEALRLLEQQVARDLDILRYPAKGWITRKPHNDVAGEDALDVLIVGAGQSGLAISFALQRMCIDNTLVIDQRPEGAEGPWMTIARMHTLRTPKHLNGVDNGISSLSPQSWYVASFGQAAWDRLGKIPREHWAQYLQWFKTVTRARVSNETRLVSFHVPDAASGLVAAELETKQGMRHVLCRRLVFATGFVGSGRWYVPPFVSDALPQSLFSHTSDAIDFAALRGKRIGILGAGASAFDNAGTALEHGAAGVELFYRRKHLPRVNPFRWAENRGFLEHYADLEDRWKWKFFSLILQNNQPPPQDTFDRCAVHEAFTLHPGEAWESVSRDEDGVVVTTPKGKYAFDHLIVGTGLYNDMSSRPEMAPYASRVAVWGDRFRPSEDVRENEMMVGMPYLGPHFEYLEKVPGALPWAGKVYNFTYGAGLSLGITSTQLSGLRFGVERLTRGIAASLFAEDVDAQFESLDAFDEPELVTDDRY